MLGMEEEVDEIAEKITETIQECALETAGEDRKVKREKWKPQTKYLLKKRRDMADKDQSARGNTEYSELCKTIMKMIKEDIQQHNTL